jgi:hypothetical protein
MKLLFHAFAFSVVFFVCSPVLAAETSFVAEATGLPDATIAAVATMLLAGGPIAGNLLAHLFMRMGWVRAAALVAQYAPFMTRAASAALRAPTVGQAARVVVIEAQKEPEFGGPMSSAARHLRDFVEEDLTPILDAVDPPKKDDGPKLPPAMGATLIMTLSVLGFVVLTAVLGGCAAKQDVEKALEAGRDVAARAEPCFYAMQQAELKQCEPENAECTARVKERWRPVAIAMNVIHDTWCALSPKSEGC